MGTSSSAAAPLLGLAGIDTGVTDAELVCPIKADDISIRWMNAYVPTADQTVKAYRPSTIAFLHRSLKAYSGMVVRGRGIPPFIHPMQMAGSGSGNGTIAGAGPSAHGSSAAALATCLSLARVCDTTLAGFSRATAEATSAVLKREMDRLYAAAQQLAQPGTTVDHFTSLAAFQAYLLYTLVLFFQLERPGDPFLRQAIMALQEIACISARHGLVCVAEQNNEQPRWPAWVVAEAKRRTLYVVYLFDSVLSAHHGQASYIGTELRGLPAPSSKALWQAASQPEWSKAYGVHLEDWGAAALPRAATLSAGLTIDELWAYPFPDDAAGLARRRDRVDRWLETVDEYGTMMYAVTSSTHGG
ncbi:hypothetical protein SCUCBS95973_007660 [Sporothrix curviconia]|uniref:C6 finger domain protein n=1 Tax=Sporothrix curviconia TaxID=1260050 RepID=A0ABP0CGE6_9PEZI